MLSFSLLPLCCCCCYQLVDLSILSHSLFSFMNYGAAAKRALHTYTHTVVHSLSHFFIFMSSLACFPRSLCVQSRVRVECRCLFLLRYFSIHLVTYFGSNYTDFRLTRSRLFENKFFFVQRVS